MTGPETSSAGVPRPSYVHNQFQKEAHKKGLKGIYFDTIERNSKQDNTLQTFLYQRPNEFFEFINAPSALSRQRRYFNTGIRIVGDEYGIHEHGLGKLAFCLPFS
jgi:hypothetical protein